MTTTQFLVAKPETDNNKNDNNEPGGVVGNDLNSVTNDHGAWLMLIVRFIPPAPFSLTFGCCSQCE